MAFKAIVITPKLESLGNAFARNKGFSEHYDRTFNDTGYDVDSPGITLLYDVRSFYGFYLWLKNTTGISINFDVKYLYKNFEDLKTETDETDWIQAKDSADADIAGALINNTNLEVEFVRATPKVTAVRVDLDGASAVILNGTFTAI